MADSESNVELPQCRRCTEQNSTYKRIEHIRSLPNYSFGTKVDFRARISTHRQLSHKLDFILLLDGTHSVQGVLSRDFADGFTWVSNLAPESLVRVYGALREPPEPVTSATESNIEVRIHTIDLVDAAKNAPFTTYRPPDTLQSRMQSRILDLRHPANQALFRLHSKVAQIFRNTLQKHGFLEIQTPKLQPAATESGAAVFKVNYFGRDAFLAQSPQLAKQMAISADFGRVYEISPVFRAENSNTYRHLTEYTSLDMEMTIKETYHEAIDIIDEFLKSVFKTVYESSYHELKTLRERWPSSGFKYLDKTLILDFREGLEMLREDGHDVEEGDLSTPDERHLGELVKEKYGTDYYILNKFPTSARPFYTYKDPNDVTLTRSFDIFIRGQEICSGGQRVNDAKELRANLRQAGIPEGDMKEYLSGFDLGTPPHAGAGLGLERILTWMLELGNVRYASLFYRDPKSLPERAPALPHPEADTMPGRRSASKLQPLEKLIANYGDSSNTSWLDERFHIWRHSSGGAIGYAKRGRLVVIIGNPLCDQRQYEEVATAFVTFLQRECRGLTPMWLLVSNEMQEILSKELKWRTFSCAEEQRMDSGRYHPNNGSHMSKVKREAIKLHEVQIDDKFIARGDKAIKEWKGNRKGKQMHMTEVRPWVDKEHRRYFAAESEEKLHAMVVLARLSPENGWHIKWTLDFPGATNGAIEALIDCVLTSVPGKATFGAGAADHLIAGNNVHRVQSWLLRKVYAAIAERFGLRRKSEFRNKFGAQGESLFICYPKRGVGISAIRDILGFFQN